MLLSQAGAMGVGFPVAWSAARRAVLAELRELERDCKTRVVCSEDLVLWRSVAAELEAAARRFTIVDSNARLLRAIARVVHHRTGVAWGHGRAVRGLEGFRSHIATCLHHR